MKNIFYLTTYKKCCRLLEMGEIPPLPKGKGILSPKQYEKIESIHLEYPERWCNILEQRALMGRLFKYYPNIKLLTITTHSVYIIQCVYSQHIGIYDNYKDFPDLHDDGQRLSPLPNEFKGLWQCTPEKIERIH